MKKNGYTPFPELYAPGNNQMPAVNQGIASQYQTLLDGVQELHDFECRHNIDLSLAVAFKLQLSQMPAFSQFVSDLHSLPVPALVFIVYANNVDTSSTNPSSSDAGYNLYKLGQYQVQDRYIFTDWQLQWTNSALVSWIQSDLAQGAGVGGFLPSNAGPEGYRNSDGQCNNYRRQDVLYPSECNSFPVNSGQNASIEFTIPVGGPQQTMATYVLSDQFQNVIRYLQVIGKRNLSWIQ